MRNWFGNDWNWIVAGLAAAIVVPVLSFLAGMPIWIAAIIGLLVFIGLIFVLAPKRMFEGLDAKAIGRGRLEFARDLLSTAAPAAERLEASANQIGSKDVAKRVRHLAEIAADVFAKVEANPKAPAPSGGSSATICRGPRRWRRALPSSRRNASRMLRAFRRSVSF